MMNKYLLTFIISTTAYWVGAQYAPGVGVKGSTAMKADSSAFKSWATGCVVTRGPQNISNSSSVLASAGNQEAGVGEAGASIVSLGDGGEAILTFATPIVNGPGNDFAVFENGFNISANSDFLELAFVEVSSDGSNYFRFPATSLTPAATQLGAFSGIDPSRINNLAGKYIAGYGTPFDLEELKNIPGLNVNSITHVKIIDVIGSVNSQYATKDSDDNVVNDPWPTEFASSGFDLDAVGVINSTVTSIAASELEKLLSVYPNPASPDEMIKIIVDGVSTENITYSLYDSQGNSISSYLYKETSGIVSLKGLVTGMYFLKIGEGNNQICRKLVIK